MKKLRTTNPALASAKVGFVLSAAAAMTTFAGAAGEVDLSSTVGPIVALINSLIAPVLAIVVAVGMIYCIFLGVSYAKAEEPQEREKAKQHLKNAVIGFLLIFVLMVALNKGIDIMVDWVNENAGTNISVSTAG